jgi:hypothetical protein
MGSSPTSKEQDARKKELANFENGCTSFPASNSPHEAHGDYPHGCKGKRRPVIVNDLVIDLLSRALRNQEKV